jgi:hypothetical protein|eukprot:SAG25_NODE_720_length_5737_cov_65.252040_3_plen_223_part_00
MYGAGLRLAGPAADWHRVNRYAIGCGVQTAAAVYKRARPYLGYADSHPRTKRIRVGVAVRNVGSKPPSYAVANETALAHLLAAAAPLLRRHPSFAGFAVFASWWYAESLAQPAPPATVWPRGTGVWYANHSMIVDPDSTSRDAWLTWAKSRGISEVYIAPHAGSVAVVSIPGVEGGPVNDRRFCNFVAQAQKQYGIEVQLMSSPSTDAHWLRNCSAANVARL